MRSRATGRVIADPRALHAAIAAVERELPNGDAAASGAAGAVRASARGDPAVACVRRRVIAPRRRT